MKLVKVIVLLVTMMISPVLQAACWDKKEYREIENFSELDDKLILSFKDAVSCQIIEGAKVQLGKLVYQTDAKGYVTLPMAPFLQADDLEMPMQVSKQGYTTISTVLKVAAGTVLNKRLLLSPSLAGNSMRFILQWNEQPQDLDLHLTGNGFHVSYRDLRAAGEARLDQDEQSGFGPETITLNNVQQDQQYTVTVVNYSADADIDETAKLLVYVGDRLDRVIPLAETRKTSVDVLKISDARILQLETKQDANQNAYLPGW
ncbi:MAG: hypothetical protein OEY36_05400 [Gammaproteobacteria bacterium]|nr:hypothetical protein [Gammaproteobacteria bacterium]